MEIILCFGVSAMQFAESCCDVTYILHHFCISSRMMKESRNDNDKNDTNHSPLEDIVYSEVEPGIITREMIEAAYLEEGYKGEESRLHRIEPVVYDRIASLRLDFKSKAEYFLDTQLIRD